MQEVTGSNLVTDSYILFSDPQFSVQNQIPETLGFKVLRGCGKLIFIIYSLSKLYVMRNIGLQKTNKHENVQLE